MHPLQHFLTFAVRAHAGAGNLIMSECEPVYVSERFPMCHIVLFSARP